MAENRKGVAVKVPDPALNGLAVLFKEILQQISADGARELQEAYNRGKVIVFTLRENSRGQFFKAAFTHFACDEFALCEGGPPKTVNAGSVASYPN